MKSDDPVIATSTALRRQLPLLAREYFELTKPRVVSLIVFTAVVGMFLSTPSGLPAVPLLLGTLGIALAAGSAAAINQILDLRFDSGMTRTSFRPLPTGSLTTREALIFALMLGVASMVILTLWVNTLTAVLTFISLIGYSIVYTVYLKHATPQNIVIGGAAGAAPPVLGWTAITGEVAADALLLFLIIFSGRRRISGHWPCTARRNTPRSAFPCSPSPMGGGTRNFKSCCIQFCSWR